MGRPSQKVITIQKDGIKYNVIDYQTTKHIAGPFEVLEQAEEYCQKLKQHEDAVWVQHSKAPLTPMVLTSAIEKAVIQKIAGRAAVGRKKYGVSMERTDLKPVDWLRHAQEEAMDLAVYLERLIQDIENGKTSLD